MRAIAVPRASTDSTAHERSLDPPITRAGRS
jgi:hypothetical protein